MHFCCLISSVATHYRSRVFAGANSQRTVAGAGEGSTPTQLMVCGPKKIARTPKRCSGLWAQFLFHFLRFRISICGYFQGTLYGFDMPGNDACAYEEITIPCARCCPVACEVAWTAWTACDDARPGAEVGALPPRDPKSTHISLGCLVSAGALTWSSGARRDRVPAPHQLYQPQLLVRRRCELRPDHRDRVLRPAVLDHRCQRGAVERVRRSGRRDRQPRPEPPECVDTGRLHDWFCRDRRR